MSSKVLGLSHIDNLLYHLGFSCKGLNGAQIVLLYIVYIEENEVPVNGRV